MIENYNPIIITPGEPSGIGPDLVIRLIQNKFPIKIVICASPDVISKRAKKLNISIILKEYDPDKNFEIKQDQSKNILHIIPVLTKKPSQIGILCKENVPYVLKTLKIACDGCLNGKFSALVTGPIHKGIINSTGKKFLGHTEFLSERCSSKYAVMMFVKRKLRIALLTTHIPLKMVSSSITQKKLYNVIKILYINLKTKFKIHNPHIFVSGINPHAGEEGFIGNEENEIIIPTLKKLIEEKIQITGPLPADSIFQYKYIKQSDVILTMYHDQGLPVIKYGEIGNSVQITFGLPFIRTSVDHGTAIEIAGSHIVKYNSIINAIKMAFFMIQNEKNIL